jgi:hypothetical protein
LLRLSAMISQYLTTPDSAAFAFHSAMSKRYDSGEHQKSCSVLHAS